MTSFRLNLDTGFGKKTVDTNTIGTKIGLEWNLYGTRTGVRQATSKLDNMAMTTRRGEMDYSTATQRERHFEIL